MPATKLPNGPRIQPWLQKLQWLIRGKEYLEECTQYYGDIFTLQIAPGNAPHVFISNPQAIKEIFAADSKKLDSGKEAGNNPFLQGENSLVALSGERHLQHRKLLIPQFHQTSIQAYSQTICELALAMANNWTIGKPFPIYKYLQELSLEVSLKVLLGIEESSACETLKKSLITILDPKISIAKFLFFLFPHMRWDLLPWTIWGNLIRQKHQIDDLIYAEIQKRRLETGNLSSPNRTDILSLMMTARDEAGKPMTDVELRDEAITAVTQSPEVTVTALTRAFYLILSNLDVQQKLLKELDALGNNPEPKEILKLPYLDALCKETLRIYPPPEFAFPRIVKSPIEILDYQFEPGTIISPCIHLTHHREDIYSDPMQFKPERFLDGEFAPYEYFPFGGGNRRCIGAAFAQLEMKLVLVTVLSRWEISLHNSKPINRSSPGHLLPPITDIAIVVKSLRSNSKL